MFLWSKGLIYLTGLHFSTSSLTSPNMTVSERPPKDGQPGKNGAGSRREESKMFTHRLLEDKDLETICTFPQSVEELFFMFPKATHPLTPEQLLDIAENRHDLTVVLVNGVVAGYANFIEVHEGSHCSVMLITLPTSNRAGTVPNPKESSIKAP